MTETHEDRVKILEGAPKINIENSVLYISSCGIYYKSIDGLNNGKNWEFWDSSRIGKTDRWDWVGDVYLTELEGLRSLSDIQQLVDVQNEIDGLESDYFEVEKERISLARFKKDIHPLLIELANCTSQNGRLNIRNLNEEYHTNMDNLDDSQKLIIEIKNRISKYE